MPVQEPTDVYLATTVADDFRRYTLVLYGNRYNARCFGLDEPNPRSFREYQIYADL